jgi:hypothetical protein
MLNSVAKMAVTLLAVVSWTSWASAASSHARHANNGHAKNVAQATSPYHPYAGVPALDSQNGWYSARNLDAPATATAAPGAQTADLSMCRMAAYLPDYAGAFGADCKTADVALAGAR